MLAPVAAVAGTVEAAKAAAATEGREVDSMEVATAAAARVAVRRAAEG